MKSLGRLFVVTGICLFALSAFAADYPVASGQHWTTTAFFVAKPNATAPVSVFIAHPLTSAEKITIQPGGEASASLNIGGDFGVMSFSDSVDTFVRLDYDADTRSSYTFRPDQSIARVRAFRFAPVVSDGITKTTVTMFCGSVTPVTLTPRNGEGTAGAREYATCVPPVSQYTVQQTFPIGSVEFAVGNIGFDDGSAWGAIYAFATVGKTDRDAFSVTAK
jgi:hypothetical protein